MRVLGATSVVDEYIREIVDGQAKYRKSQSTVEFSAYVRANGFKIIPVSSAQQLAYGCNVLNLGHSNIIAVHEETARVIAQSPHFRGRIRYHDFSSITSMYGAVHCATQVVRRRPGVTPDSQSVDVVNWIKRQRRTDVNDH